jgi:hypothetical protein
MHTTYLRTKGGVANSIARSTTTPAVIKPAVTVGSCPVDTALVLLALVIKVNRLL